MLLQNYSEKGDKDRIAAAKEEMRAFGIRMTPCKFGQDNRDYFIDHEAGTISDALSSVKHIGRGVARSLYRMREKRYPCFTDVLYDMEMDPVIDATAMEILIRMGYFDIFGGSGKLLNLFKAFREGALRFSKTHVDATQQKRLAALRVFEASLPDAHLPLLDQFRFELEHYGLPLTTFPNAHACYGVIQIDERHSPKVRLYNLETGRTGVMKIRKPTFQADP